MHKLRIATWIWRAGLIALLLASCAAQPAVAPQPIAPSVVAETPTPQPAAVATQQPTATSTATSTAEASATPSPVITPAASPIEYLSAPQIAETIGQDMSQGVARYLLGADMQTPEEVQQMLNGRLARVTVGEGKTALVVLAETADANPTADDLSQPPWLTSLQTALEGGLKLSASDLLLVEQDDQGQPRVWFTQYPNLEYFVGYIKPDGAVTRFPEKLIKELVVVPYGDAAYKAITMRWDSQRRTMVTANEFQLLFEYVDGQWQSRRLPHECYQGACEYRTMDEVVQLGLKKLRGSTGYLAEPRQDWTLAETATCIAYYKVLDEAKQVEIADVYVDHQGAPRFVIVRASLLENPSFQPLTEQQAMAFLEALRIIEQADPGDETTPGFLDNMWQMANALVLTAKIDLPFEYISSHSNPDDKDFRGWDTVMINPNRFPGADAPMFDHIVIAFVNTMVETSELVHHRYYQIGETPPQEDFPYTVDQDLKDQYPPTDFRISLLSASLNAREWLELHGTKLPSSFYADVAYRMDWWAGQLREDLGL